MCQPITNRIAILPYLTPDGSSKTWSPIEKVSQAISCRVYEKCGILLQDVFAKVMNVTRTIFPDACRCLCLLMEQTPLPEEKARAKDRRSAKTGVRSGRAPSSTVPGADDADPDPMTYALEEVR